MLKAWSSNESPRIALVILTLIGIIGLASTASAQPIVPWADYQTFSSGTAAVGVEPNTSAAYTDWGPAISFSLPNNSSFTSVAYTPGAPGSPPAYASNAYSANLNGSFPGGPSLQPSNASPLNITEVVPYVASSVTAISTTGGLVYTDQYPYGTKLAVGATSNTNYPGFNPGANAAIIAGNFVGGGGSIGTITMQWRTRSQNEMAKGTSSYNDLPVNANYLASDAMQLSGQQQGYDYVLQMDFSNQVEVPTDQANDILANRALYLGELVCAGHPGAGWVNAINQNVATGSGLPAEGAYAWQGPGYLSYGSTTASPYDRRLSGHSSNSSIPPTL